MVDKMKEKNESLSPAEWGQRKHELWDSIHYFIGKEKKDQLNNEINRYINKKEELKEIEILTLNYLKNLTDLININYISGQEDTVSHFIRQYIIAIWLMNEEIPADRRLIKEMSNLDYKIINQIAVHLDVKLPQAKTGKRIDPDLLRKILDELQHEIDRYDLGLDPASLNKIGNRLSVNQSVISYWGEKEHPTEYNEIWGGMRIGMYQRSYSH